MNYVLFIGSKLGYKMLELMSEKNTHIIYVFVEKEHEHENETFYRQAIKLCEENNINFRLNASNKEVIECLNAIPTNIEYIMSFGYRKMISPEVVDRASIAALGSHFSPLPRYRGFAPLNWLLINGEDYTAVNLFFLEQEVDNGDIVASKEIEIAYCDNINSLFDKCLSTFEELMIKTLPSLENNNFTASKQSNEEASYTCARSPEDGKINWASSSYDIYNLVRGLTYPYPGAYTYFENKKLIVVSCEEYNPGNYVGRVPGRVIKVIKGRGVVVLCGDKAICIKKVIDQDGKVHRANNLITSVRATLR
ncbi:methionyl-tRNA formyltransferase [Salinicoccus sesuvii]|uniref:Methionyl-tRNA formyltransferase n=1 Tax=Salinicoccus sesuvii TaxID=868281 RepID=A0ABV7N691_9STAP